MGHPLGRTVGWGLLVALSCKPALFTTESPPLTLVVPVSPDEQQIELRVLVKGEDRRDPWRVHIDLSGVLAADSGDTDGTGGQPDSADTAAPGVSYRASLGGDEESDVVPGEDFLMSGEVACRATGGSCEVRLLLVLGGTPELSPDEVWTLELDAWAGDTTSWLCLGADRPRLPDSVKLEYEPAY